MAYQKIKNKRPNKRMMPFGEKVAWMMHKDNNRRNKMEPLRQYGVFAGIVQRTGVFTAPTPEGTISVRTIYRLSED